MKPKVSIIVTVYNQADLIIRALESIPIRDDIEVVVYDDCSTDGTFELIQRFADEHQGLQIRLYRTDENIGIGATKNLLYEAAQGEYIHELDSDDYLYTELYSNVIDDLSGEDITYINLVINSGDVFRLTPDSRRGYCAGIARFIRREFLGDTRCENVRCAEDWDFNEKLIAKNPTEKFTSVSAYHYNFPREGSLYDRVVKGLI